MFQISKLAAAMMVAMGLGACASHAPAGVPVAIHSVAAANAGAALGQIVLRDGPNGVVLEAHLRGLPPGDHGMHVHAVASCEPAVGPTGEMAPAGSAGGHFDPAHTNRHEGPMGAGHLGDLPVLTVNAQGDANQTLTAPHFHSVDELRGHAIIIHANGDNYSDTPAPLGGGGARIACGVVG